MNKAFSIQCPSKINLFLKIGRKTSQGLHTISSLMVPLQSPHDTLTFKISKKQTLKVKTTLSPKLTAFQKQKPGFQKNIVTRAARLFFKAIRQKPKIEIQLQKEIPMGGGMGGGSSNAAHTLLGLNALHRCPLKKQKLLALARQLGSDVPFFLYATPRLVHGTGDRMSPPPPIPKGWVVILNPKETISTPKAYQMWDKYVVSLTKKNQNVKNGTLFEHPRTWENDFEKVIFPMKPVLEKAKDMLLKAGAVIAGMSGSGPTLYGLFKDKKSAEKAMKLFHTQRWIGWMTKGPKGVKRWKLQK